MDPQQLRNKIDEHGGVLEALAEDIRDTDIDDEDLADLWFDMTDNFTELEGKIAEFEDFLAAKLSEDPVLD